MAASGASSGRVALNGTARNGATRNGTARNGATRNGAARPRRLVGTRFVKMPNRNLECRLRNG